MSNFGPRGNLLSGEQAISYARKKGLCPNCSQQTHQAVGNIWTKKMVPLGEVKDKNGAVVVYKGHCVQPTCNTLNDVRRLLGEPISRERRRRKTVQDPITGRIADVSRHTRASRAHTQDQLTLDATIREAGSMLLDDNSSSHQSGGFQYNLHSSSELDLGNSVDDSVSSSLHASGPITVPDRLSESTQPTLQLTEPDTQSKSTSGDATSEPLPFQGDYSQSCSFESSIATKSLSSNDASQVGPNVEISETFYNPKLEEIREAASAGDFTLLLILLERESNQSNHETVSKAFGLLCQYIPSTKGSNYVFANDFWVKSLKVVIENNAEDEEIQSMAVSTLAVLSAVSDHYMFDIVNYGGVKLVLSILDKYKESSQIVDYCCCAIFCMIDRNFRAEDPMPNRTGLLMKHEMASPAVESLISVIETASTSAKIWIVSSLLNLSLQNLSSRDDKTFGQVLHDAASGQGIDILIRTMHGDAEQPGVALPGLQLLARLVRRPDDEQAVMYGSEELMAMIITVINGIEDVMVRDAGFCLLGSLTWGPSCLSSTSMISLSETIATSMTSFLDDEELQIDALKSVSNSLRPSPERDEILKWDGLVSAIIMAMHEHVQNLELQCSGCLALATIASGSDTCKLAVLQGGGVQTVARAIKTHLDGLQQTSDVSDDLILFGCTMFASLAVSPLTLPDLSKHPDIAIFMDAANLRGDRLPIATRLAWSTVLTASAETTGEEAIALLLKASSLEETEKSLLSVRNLCERSSHTLTCLIAAEGGTGISLVTSLMSRYTVSLAVQEAACDILWEMYSMFPFQGQLGQARQVEIGSTVFSVVTHSEVEIVSIRKAIKVHKTKASFIGKAFDALSGFFRTASDDDFRTNEKLRACFSGIFKDCVDAFSVHRNNLEVFNSGMQLVRCLLLLQDQSELRRWGSYLVNAILSNVQRHDENDETTIRVGYTIQAILAEEHDDSAIALMDKQGFASSFLHFLASDTKEVVEVASVLVAAVASRVVALIEHFLYAPDFTLMIVNCINRFADSSPIVESCCSIIAAVSTLYDDTFMLDFFHCGGAAAILNAIETHEGDELVQESAWKAFAGVLQVIPPSDLDEIRSIIAEATLRSLQRNMMSVETEIPTLDVFWYLCTQEGWFQDYFTENQGVANVIEVMDLYLHDRRLQGAGCTCLWIVALHGENKVTIANAGGLSSIINAMLAHLSEGQIQKDSLTTLKNLATVTRNKDILRAYGGEDAIVISMRGNLASHEIVAAALAALNNVAVDSTTRVVTEVPVGAFDCILVGMETHIRSKEVQTNACFLLKSYSFSNASLDIMRSRAAYFVQRLASAAAAFPDTCEERAYYVIEKLV